MADKKKEKLEHIQVKDNGIKLSHKIGDTLGDSKQTLQNEIINSLLKGRNETSLVRYRITQNNQLRDFKVKTNKLINQTKKAVKTAFKSDTTVNLTDKQIKNMTGQIDKGLLFLEQSAIQQYQNTIKSVVLKCKTAGDLKDQLQKHIESGVNVGVVYKDGKEFKFDNYWEMKTRTDIQQDIGKNMVDTGSALGVIFYIAAYFGDCAKDHVDYQGKIYVDKDWKSNAPKDRIDEIQSYIDSKSIKTVQEVMDAPAYFTTRPNCRHYFQYIDIDSVLGAKNKDDVNKLRDERNLNYNGKYKPEKYKALQEQRLNERRIRYKKEEIQKQEQLLALNPGDKVIQSRIMAGESMVRKYQADQRELIKQYDNLERQYSREKIGNRVDLGSNINFNNKRCQGANDNYTFENHPKPEYIKTIDVNNRNDVDSVLNDFKKEYGNLQTENAIIISSKGDVYRCFGSKDRVYADSDLPTSTLKGCIFIHNHPKDVTSYSFSEDDLNSYKNLEMKEMHALDDKYEYSFTRNGRKTEQIELSIESASLENYQDWYIRRLLKESDIFYERKVKTK